ncbi:MAG: hypothetical protein LC623_01705, partial [Halobacteriales archaeon]|nr:hypothetical protein [Halobacteriales archaeon]
MSDGPERQWNHARSTTQGFAAERPARLASAGLCILLAALALHPALAANALAGPPPTAQAAPQGTGILFEKNVGQWDAQALF